MVAYRFEKKFNVALDDDFQVKALFQQ